MSRTTFALAILLISALPVAASAHSVVSPSQTLISKYETFSLGVPSEKDEATVSTRLVIPAELSHVAPIVKPGWRVAVMKDAKGKVIQLVWTGGAIPPEQKDFFEFSARTPADPSTLVWKAYQTYQGGEIVEWDQDPHGNHDESGVVGTVSNPYSTTEVMAIAAVPSTASSMLPNAFALAALALSALALLLTLRNKRAMAAI